MSVINDMLNDLEQRQVQQHPSLTGSVNQHLNAVAPVSNRSRNLWWMMGLLSMFLVAWLGWRYLPQLVSRSHALPTQVQTSAAVAEPIEPADSVVPVQDETTAPAKPEPIQVVSEASPVETELKRIEIGEEAGRYQVDMEFSQPLSAPLLKIREGDRIKLHLFAATESGLELPVLPERTLIHSWRSYLADGVQVVSLGVDPSVDVELIQLASAAWRLTLQPPFRVKENKPEPTHQTPQVIEPVSQQKSAKRPLRGTPQPALPAVKKAKDLYEAAAAALANGRSMQAEKLLKEILARQPAHLAASQLLGRLYLDDGRMELAESVTLAALQHHPEQVELISTFTRSLLGQQRLDEAGEYLYRVMHKEHAPHLGLMAVIRQRQGQHREASGYYKLALHLRPHEVTWLTGLGISLEHLNELDAARQIYQRSLASGKLSVALHGFVEERLGLLTKHD